MYLDKGINKVNINIEKVNETTVYNAAKRYGLYLPRPKDLVDNYHGIPLEVLKKELITMPVCTLAF